jgi:tripartite-type tricarboxylate transporter receptor subunit TctC
MPQARSMFDGGVMSKLRYSLRAMLAAGLVVAAAAAGQSYPSQQIRMVVGYAAGGGADGLIRAIAPELSELMGQPIVVAEMEKWGKIIREAGIKVE